MAPRKHSAELRAEVVRACHQPGASVAAIELRNGLNANLVHRWLREDDRSLDAGVGNRAAAITRPGAEFIPVQLRQSFEFSDYCRFNSDELLTTL